MKAEILGKYNEKMVLFFDIDKLTKVSLENETFSDLVLFIYFNLNFDLEKANKLHLLDLIIKLNPLAITVAGNNSEKIFDQLLHKLSIKHSKYHIMTKNIKERSFKKCVQDFFYNTWPAEENFDRWEKYALMFINGDSKYKQEIINLLK